MWGGPNPRLPSGCYVKSWGSCMNISLYGVSLYLLMPSVLALVASVNSVNSGPSKFWGGPDPRLPSGCAHGMVPKSPITVILSGMSCQHVARVFLVHGVDITTTYRQTRSIETGQPQSPHPARQSEQLRQTF